MSNGSNLFVIYGKIYTIVNENNKQDVYMDGKDIADFPTENTARTWIKDRARKKNLSEKTNQFLNSLRT